MADRRTVHHDGTVVSVNGDRVQVEIISKSACADCHAKHMCTAADMQEKIIDAIAAEPLTKGDVVSVKMEEKLGWIALFYGFVLPFIVMVTVLFTLNGLGYPETRAALFSLAALVPYYSVLYFFRKKFEKEFVFRAEKKNKF